MIAYLKKSYYIKGTNDVFAYSMCHFRFGSLYGYTQWSKSVKFFLIQLKYAGFYIIKMLMGDAAR